MKKNKKFEAFLAKHFTIENETLSLESLKNYMFSLPVDEMLEFMKYNQDMCFTSVRTHLDNPLCTDEDRSEIFHQLNSIEAILTTNRASKAA